MNAAATGVCCHSSDSRITTYTVRIISSDNDTYVPVGNETLVLYSGPVPHMLVAVTVIL